jgi:nucleotide-binding universal stress UspA family protein
MRRQAAGRVILGVDDSLAGLQALREAVGLARSRGMELLALRACHPPAAGADFSCWPGVEAGLALTPPSQDLCEQLARSYVDHVFCEAMGALPQDVPVEIFVAYQPARQALTTAAYRDADLLVVGASRHHPWWPLRRSVGHYCAAHARCPVLIVPPHQTARELGLTGRPWGRLRKRREFASLLPGTSSHKAHGLA